MSSEVGTYNSSSHHHHHLSLSGSRRESHPPAPTDPGVTISRHRALVILSTRVRTHARPDGFSLSTQLLPENPLPVDRPNTPQMTPAPWLHPHRAQQGLHGYYEPVRQRVPRRYSLPCGAAAWQAPSRPPPRGERQCRDTPSHVPCTSSRPGSRRLHAGHRLARNTDTRQTHPGLTYYTPVSMPPY